VHCARWRYRDGGLAALCTKARGGRPRRVSPAKDQGGGRDAARAQERHILERAPATR